MYYSLRPLVVNLQDPNVAGGGSPWVVGGAITLFYALFAAIAGDVWRLPASRLSVWVGLMTYPVYLLHQNIGYMLIEALRGALAQFPLRVLLVFGIVVAAAWLIVRFVERPLAPRLRRALAAERSPTAVPTGAT